MMVGISTMYKLIIHIERQGIGKYIPEWSSDNCIKIDTALLVKYSKVGPYESWVNIN